MLDARAWLLWALTVLVAASLTRNPLYIVLLLLVVAVTDMAIVAKGSARARRLPSPLTFAKIALPLAIVFNALVVHIGDTILFRLPESLPLIGGAITLEAVVYGLLNGLTLTLIFAGFSVFNEITPSHELVQLAPRAFHEAGVVLSIALTFVPQTTRSLQRIREAQAVRGHRLRGLSDWLPIVVPLLVSGMERSMGLAEAMVARGYGSVRSRSQPLRLQMLLILGLLSLLGGWLGWVFFRPITGSALGPTAIVAATAIVGGSALIMATLWLAGRHAPRNRYRLRHWSLADTGVTLGCLLTLATVILPLPFADTGTIYYSPYPALSVPAFDPWIGILLLGLLGPVLVSMYSPQGRGEASAVPQGTPVP